MNDQAHHTTLRRWLLMLSLVLNLFLLAAIAGGAWRWWAVRTHDAPPVHAKAAAEEAALSMISQGADFVVPNASGATVGGYQAIAESGKDVRSFSIFSDFTPVAPDNILGLYVADYAQGVVEVVKSIKDGTPPTENVVFGLKDPKVISFTFRDDGPVSVPAEIRAEVKAISDKIAAGEIKTDGQ